jgi:formate/nitrite transporter FocA (FNT family)/nucleotide-binding universal stress UspA family protein
MSGSEGAGTTDERAGTSESGVPAEGALVRDRFSSDEVFQRIIAAADEEITSSRRELFFAGLAGGLAITITVLVYSSMIATTGEVTGDSVVGYNSVVASLLYPIGFIYIIIGGYQLYTENTLPPVALTLERFASIPALLRNWSIVLLGNFTGGAIGAIVLAHGGVLTGGADVAAMQISQSGIDEEAFSLFTKGAVAGLVVAGVVWVEYASRDTISRLVVVYLAFLCIPLGNLYHSVVSFTEMCYLLLLGEVGVALGMTDFVIPVLLGNTIGGVVLVTVVNYYQTSESRLGSMYDSEITKLSKREWLFGRFAGRSYVPLIDTHERTGAPVSDDAFRLMVPVSNPRTDTRLVELACTIADQKPSATVHLVHIVQMPRGTTYEYTGRQRSRITSESKKRLTTLQDSLDYDDIAIEASTVVSYNSFEEIFSQARQDKADLVVMDWDENDSWGTLRSGRPIDELTSTLPCDFLVLRDRGFDTSEVLLPTAGGPDSDLSADVARALRDSVGSTVRLLHVVDSPAEREAGEQFLEAWAAERDLADTEQIIDDSGDVERAIAREAPDPGLVLIGATERGMISRLARGSLHLKVIEEVDSSVLLVERPHRRGLLQRLFG